MKRQKITEDILKTFKNKIARSELMFTLYFNWLIGLAFLQSKVCPYQNLTGSYFGHIKRMILK